MDALLARQHAFYQARLARCDAAPGLHLAERRVLRAYLVLLDRAGDHDRFWPAHAGGGHATAL
ncbi:MAG: hypothetical protein H6709_25030, partial [Kofleriaceae bacterium]|nr:hypothetical protein [Kofleriaceae bacterium]